MTNLYFHTSHNRVRIQIVLEHIEFASKIWALKDPNFYLWVGGVNQVQIISTMIIFGR